MRDDATPNDVMSDDPSDDVFELPVTDQRGPRWFRRRTVVLATAAVLLSIVALIVGGVAALTQTDRGRAVILRARR
jgi:hypothetical protein